MAAVALATGQDAASLLSLVGPRRLGPLVFSALQERAASASGAGPRGGSASERRAAAMAAKLARRGR